MKTIFAIAFSLAVALFGAAGAAPAWAWSGTPSVFPRQEDPWRNWPPRDGHFRGDFHHGGHFRGHDGRNVIVVPGGPRVVPGYWAWNGYGWMWVPAYWVR
jgi:hypothetical protein